VTEPTKLSHLAAVTTGVTRSPAGRDRLSVFLEDPDHLEVLSRRGLCSRGPVVFSPELTTSPAATAATVIGYRGGLEAPTDQLWLDDSFVMEVQSYAVSGFLAVHGPTLLRICGPEDLLALGADAVAARDTGRLPRLAASPLVHLADTPALGWPGVHHHSHRIHVRADGTVSVSPSGSTVATLDTLSAHTLARLAGSGAGGVEVDAVSGFGARLDPRVPLEDGTGAVERPVVLLSADRGLVVDPVSGRVVRLDLASATALERQLDGTGDPAGARLATVLASRGFDVAAEVAA
jgi:hypothetical protein